MKRKITIVFILFLLIVANSAMALRCGNFFVKPGVLNSEVLRNCGDPVSKEDLGTSRKSGAIKEMWTYGPHQGKWYYYLYFKAGVLKKVESKKKIALFRPGI